MRTAIIPACLLAIFSYEAFAEDWDPPAVVDFPVHDDFVDGTRNTEELVQAGRRLFLAKFNVHDGAGRPAATGDSKPTMRIPGPGTAFLRVPGPDAMACGSCHNDPELGGSGDFVANVFVGAHLTDPPTSSVTPAKTAERNTTSLHGAGLIEFIAREMTYELHEQRDSARERAMTDGVTVQVDLVAKGVSFGSITLRPDGSTDAPNLNGIDYDLIVRPFGVKGVAASIREFTLFALNQHHGIQAVERFGWERTGLRDFDLDGVEIEFTIGQTSALVAFQANLPPPPQNYSSDPTMHLQERKGEKIFSSIKCNSCHVKEYTIAETFLTEPSPFNRPGAVTPSDVLGEIEVPLRFREPGRTTVMPFTDFRRHNLCDDEVNHFCNEEIRQDNVAPELFLTAKLWDLATSAPYGHRGDLTTISSAIMAHGGEARDSREGFLRLAHPDKQALIRYLMTLGRATE